MHAGPWDSPRHLPPGQFVVVEPDLSEFVCADPDQLLRRLRECERRGLVVSVRWKRADGSVARHSGPPPQWGTDICGAGVVNEAHPRGDPPVLPPGVAAWPVVDVAVRFGWLVPRWIATSEHPRAGLVRG